MRLKMERMLFNNDVTKLRNDAQNLQRKTRDIRSLDMKVFAYFLLKMTIAFGACMRFRVNRCETASNIVMFFYLQMTYC